jgi:small subunit ribosomal protein S6
MPGGTAIIPYEIMLILNPEADESRQEEILERVRQLIAGAGGEVSHVDDWGRKKIAYPIHKQPDGRYVVVTCDTAPAALDEIERVMAINKDVVLRAMPIRLRPAQAERARDRGAPVPVDDRPEGEARARPGARGGRGRRPR